MKDEFIDNTGRAIPYTTRVEDYNLGPYPSNEQLVQFIQEYAIEEDAQRGLSKKELRKIKDIFLSKYPIDQWGLEYRKFITRSK